MSIAKTKKSVTPFTNTPSESTQPYLYEIYEPTTGCTWEQYHAAGNTKLEFVKLVYATSESTYPKNGVHTDGYYYALVQSNTVIPNKTQDMKTNKRHGMYSTSSRLTTRYPGVDTSNISKMFDSKNLFPHDNNLSIRPIGVIGINNRILVFSVDHSTTGGDIKVFENKNGRWSAQSITSALNSAAEAKSDQLVPWGSTYVVYWYSKIWMVSTSAPIYEQSPASDRGFIVLSSNDGYTWKAEYSFSNGWGMQLLKATVIDNILWIYGGYCDYSGSNTWDTAFILKGTTSTPPGAWTPTDFFKNVYYRCEITDMSKVNGKLYFLTQYTENKGGNSKWATYTMNENFGNVLEIPNAVSDNGGYTSDRIARFHYKKYTYTLWPSARYSSDCIKWNGLSWDSEIAGMTCGYMYTYNDICYLIGAKLSSTNPSLLCFAKSTDGINFKSCGTPIAVPSNEGVGAWATRGFVDSTGIYGTFGLYNESTRISYITVAGVTQIPSKYPGYSHSSYPNKILMPFNEKITHHGSSSTKGKYKYPVFQSSSYMNYVKTVLSDTDLLSGQVSGMYNNQFYVKFVDGYNPIQKT